MYNKNDYYCIDGFPQDGFPCVVVLPPPYRSGYVYQGIKPAILPVDVATEEIIEHVRHKQEELLEKLKSKRQANNNYMQEDGEQQNEEQLEKRDIEDKKSIISAYRARLGTMQQEMNQLRDSRDSLLSKQRL